MSVELESSGRLGNALFAALAKNGMSLRDLAVQTDSTYEHMRKMTKGMAFATDVRLRQICKVLGLNFSEMQKLMTQDKMEKRFGKNAYAMSSRDPRSAQFDQVIPHLTDEQVEMLLTQGRALMRSNRSNHRKGA